MRYSQIRQGVITHNAQEKNVLADTDEIAVSDSQDANIQKRVSWGVLNSLAATLRNKILLSPKVDKLADTSGATSVVLTPTPGGSVNYLNVVGSTAATSVGEGVKVFANGPGAAVALNLYSQGTGPVNLRSNSNGVILSGTTVASGVNYIRVGNAAAGGGPYVAVAGSDTNINCDLWPQNAGVVRANGTQVETKGHTHTVAQVTGARSWAAVPANAAAPGTPGQEAYDADWHYVCVFTNTWKRTPLTTWTTP
jgi:hypothetical protein